MQLCTSVAAILLSEKMGFDVQLVDGKTSKQAYEDLAEGDHALSRRQVHLHAYLPRALLSASLEAERARDGEEQGSDMSDVDKVGGVRKCREQGWG